MKHQIYDYLQDSQPPQAEGFSRQPRSSTGKRSLIVDGFKG
ncbi:hypothetical protein HanPSC8_Chr02g0081471 [Helianthus annuus]|nr:hypothetical protein HanIR_Chr02g0097311 [Helianthus annuus]KAJ0953228.1 hypothetical protein HanPSC8_Chr02g0081471 [Helianthus annuus]